MKKFVFSSTKFLKSKKQEIKDLKCYLEVCHQHMKTSLGNVNFKDIGKLELKKDNPLHVMFEGFHKLISKNSNA